MSYLNKPSDPQPMTDISQNMESAIINIMSILEPFQWQHQNEIVLAVIQRIKDDRSQHINSLSNQIRADEKEHLSLLQALNEITNTAPVDKNPR